MKKVKALLFLHPFTSLSMTNLFSPFKAQELFRETGVWQLSLKEKNQKKINFQNAIQNRVMKSRAPDSISEDLSTNPFWCFTRANIQQPKLCSFVLTKHDHAKLCPQLKTKAIEICTIHYVRQHNPLSFQQRGRSDTALEKCSTDSSAWSLLK